MLEESRAVESFEFIGGRLCLDFINTLSDRWRETPVEVLHTYDDFLIWASQAHVLDEGQVQQLRQQSAERPRQAERWLAEEKSTRALLARIIAPVANGKSAPAEDLDQYNHLLARTMTHLSLVPCASGFAWHWNSTGALHELPLWLVVRDAADLLTSPDLRFLRMCASENCDWLFMDTSKNHSRRWCDMKVCGNRAKARRYYGRQVGNELL